MERVYDLAIIGGGLAGASTAYFACRRGARVVLLERADVNLGASGSNAGSIHAQIPFDPFQTLGRDWARRYAETIPLFMASIARWRGLEDELDGSLGLSLKGGLMVARTPADVAALRDKSEIERAAGLAVTNLEGEALHDHLPGLAPDMLGGAFCPIEGKADPFRVAPLFVRRAIEAGLTLLRGHKVHAIAKEGDVFTLSAGSETIQARRVVNAAGADAARVSAMVGVRVPIEAHAIQVAVTERCPPVLPYLPLLHGREADAEAVGRGQLPDRRRVAGPFGRTGRPVPHRRYRLDGEEPRRRLRGAADAGRRANRPELGRFRQRNARLAPRAGGNTSRAGLLPQPLSLDGLHRRARHLGGHRRAGPRRNAARRSLELRTGGAGLANRMT